MINLISGLEDIARQALVDEFKKRGEGTVFVYDSISDTMQEIELTVENIVENKGSNFVNAWEHAYISAYLCDMMGNIPSESLGAIKEIATVYQWSRDSLKDLYNNKKGIEAYGNSGSLEEAAGKIFEMIYDTPDGGGLTSEKQNPELVIFDTDPRLDNAATILSFAAEIIKKILLPNPIAAKHIYDAAKSILPKIIDPLIIDLDMDGLETTPLEDGFCFDHENDGFREISAWVSKDDGILAYDKNNNGKIDNGNEIFGDNYIKSDGTKATSGFDALSDLDSNNDGVIDARDENFANIKILKGDGTILTLEEAGISSISLSKTQINNVDANGNTQLSSGTYTRADGTTGTLGDFSLITDKLYSVAEDIIEVPESISKLPNIMGYGTVYSLHQAMARDSVLANLVQQFVNETNLTTKQSILKEIIFQWSGANDINSDSRGPNIDAKYLYVLEKFMGETFVGVDGYNNPNNQASNVLMGAYSKLAQYIYAELESQSTLKPLYDLITTSLKSNNLTLNITAVINYIAENLNNDVITGRNLLQDFVNTFKTLGFAELSNYQEFYDYFASLGEDLKILMDIADKVKNELGTTGNDYIEGTAADEAIMASDGDDTIFSRQGDDIVYGGNGNDYIDTCEGNDILMGEAGNDTLIGKDGDDTLYGGEDNDLLDGGNGEDYLDGGSGNDTLQGGWNSDTLIGGTGNDYLDGGAGDDLYIFNLGDGNDTIMTGGGNDVLQFGEGITKDNIKFHGEGNDLIISFGNQNDIIRVKNFLSSRVITNFKFADGSSYTPDDIFDRLVIYGNEFNSYLKGSIASETIISYEGNDTILAQDGNDIVFAGAGNDSIFGEMGNDTLFGEDGNDLLDGSNGEDYLDGGSGNDTLQGGWSNDTLIGGTGDDYLDGGAGDDLYIFNLGDGNDTIMTGGGNDVLQFGEGITKDNIKFHGEGNDLIISFGNQNDIIRVKNFLSSRVITNFKFADGSSYTPDDIFDRLVIYGNEFNSYLKGSIASETIISYEGNDTILAQDGNDIVFAGAGNDSIFGEMGNDTLFGEDGNDLLDGSNGEDYLDGGSGNDTLQGGWSNDTLIGGTGNDYLDGGAGDDLYIFNLGDGNDTIMTGGGNDVLQFGEGITKDNIKFHGEGNDLIISFGNQNDIIRVKNFLSSRVITNFKFADGSSYTPDDIFDRLVIYGNEFNSYLKGSIASETIISYEGNDTILAQDGNDIVFAGAGNDSIFGEMGNDTLFGEDGNDLLDGSNGEDYLDGGSGNDTLQGGWSNDTLIGGTGNDYLDGGAGDDLYIFNLGDGNDTIVTGSGNDVLQFGNGINEDNLQFFSQNNDLIIKFTNNESTIRIKNFISGGNNQIKTILFADGTTLDVSEILNLIVPQEEEIISLIDGTDDNDVINGTEGKDSIQSKNGDDLIFAEAGNDTIISGDGNDTIYGGDGNDKIVATKGSNYLDGGNGNDSIQGSNTSNVNETIIGGLGNDSINGGYANTLYIYNLGDGDDTIVEAGGNDTILFGEGISTNNIIFYGENNDLIISFLNESGSIRIKDGISNSNKIIEHFKFSDDSELTYSQVLELLNNQGTNGDDVITGSNTSDIINGLNGNDTINALSGNDTIYTGNGNNIVNAGSGNDIIFAGSGNDSIVAENGNDTIYGGNGNDTIIASNDSNYIDGGAGNDSIIGSNTQNANDTIIGGAGNDSINGGYANSLYIYNLGDGNDTIIDNRGEDTILFGEGVTQANIQFKGENNDLIISFKDNAGSIRIKEALSNSNKIIEHFIFSDNTELTHSQVLELLNIYGTESTDFIIGSNVAETIYGYGGNDSISALKGDDLIYAGAGNDTIEAGEGNDTVFGGSGNDSIIAGNGSDYLDGGDGNDTIMGSTTSNATDTIIGGLGNDYLNGKNANSLYLFNLGDGIDTIYDESGTDSILFNSDVSKQNIAVFKDGNNLVIDYGSNANTDQIIIRNYNNNSNSIENIQLSDGTYITNSEINQLIQSLTAYATDNDIQLTNITDVKNNEQLMTLIANSWHN